MQCKGTDNECAMLGSLEKLDCAEPVNRVEAASASDAPQRRLEAPAVPPRLHSSAKHTTGARFEVYLRDSCNVVILTYL